MKAIFFMSLFLIAAQSQAKTVVGSDYTSIAYADCKTIKDSELDKDAPIDYYTGNCAGLAGYGITVTGGDLRYDIVLTYKGTEIQTNNLWSFHNPGSDKVEWRYEVNGKGKKVYTALIYRQDFQYQDEVDGSIDPTDHTQLVVVRLNGKKSCRIGIVAQQKNMNLAARNLADSKNTACQVDEQN